MSTLTKSVCGRGPAVMLEQQFHGMVVLTGVRATHMRVWLNGAVEGERVYHRGRTKGADISWRTRSIGKANHDNVIVIIPHVSYTIH